MSNCSISEQIKQYVSTRTALVAMGIKVTRLGLFEPMEQLVQINEKTVKYTSVAKLKSACWAMLCGAHGMVEINKRLRPDRGLQAAVGLAGCAEQSVVQDTLDACTAENVIQMEQANRRIYQRFGHGYHHDYQHHWQLLDVDFTGQPCGKKAAFASKAYFVGQRNRRGRQVGYVVATRYGEIVVKQVYGGDARLSTSLPGLLEKAEQTLGMDARKRGRTIIRVDAGGGSVGDINWLLERGYKVHTKDYVAHRVGELARSVTQWYPDPADSKREMGWITQQTALYCAPVQRIAVRCVRRNGQYRYGVIVTNLSTAEVLALTGQSAAASPEPRDVLLAYVHFYDQRGGGVETEIKQDKQGLGSGKRNKKRFEAQQMLTQLEALAHNLIVWIRDWLAPYCPKLKQFGILRWVRDVFSINGLVWVNADLHIVHIILSQMDPLARQVSAGLAALLTEEQVGICLGEI
jgi:hypothetical protein